MKIALKSTLPLFPNPNFPQKRLAKVVLLKSNRLIPYAKYIIPQKYAHMYRKLEEDKKKKKKKRPSVALDVGHLQSPQISFSTFPFTEPFEGSFISEPLVPRGKETPSQEGSQLRITSSRARRNSNAIAVHFPRSDRSFSFWILL